MDGQQNTDPAWSPDGKWIAYHSVAHHGIWVKPVDGGPSRQVTEFGSAPAWSPDGRQLAFRSYEPSSLAASDWPGDGESTIWTVAADGSQLQQITTARNPAGQHADPSWSPDGKRLMFASLGIITMGFRGALWTVDVASGALQPVAQGQIWAAANPVFAPDGKGVYFAGRPKFEGASGVYYVPLDGVQKPVELCRTKQAVPARIAVSRDGKSLAFTRMVNISQIWITGGRRRRGPAPVSGFRGSRTRPDVFAGWEADDVSGADRRFESGDLDDGCRRRARQAFCARRPATATARVGTAMEPRCCSTCFQERVQRSVRFGLTDGSRQTVWETNEPVARVHMTPDEQELIYDTGRPRNIWKLHIKGTQARQLTFERERAWFPEDLLGRKVDRVSGGPGRQFTGGRDGHQRRTAGDPDAGTRQAIFAFVRIGQPAHRLRGIREGGVEPLLDRPDHAGAQTDHPPHRLRFVRAESRVAARARNRWPTNTPRSKAMSSCCRWVRDGGYRRARRHRPAGCLPMRRACAACVRLPRPGGRPPR